MSNLPVPLPLPVLQRLYWSKIAARLSLALVWSYEGLVPKILFQAVHPEQSALVLRTGIYWGSPERTLWWLGVAMILTGLLLASGWAERALVALTTAGMAVLMVLVAYGRPSMLTDPFGALIKDGSLFACALTVWWVAPLVRGYRGSLRVRASLLSGPTLALSPQGR